MKKYYIILVIILSTWNCYSQDMYNLWLQYKTITSEQHLKAYKKVLSNVQVNSNSETALLLKEELVKASNAMLSTTPNFTSEHPTLLISKFTDINVNLKPEQTDILQINDEGYIIYQKSDQIIITASTDIGLLYGTFEFLRKIQLQHSLQHIHIVNSPKTKIRVLNHWDNLDGYVERGYAGSSIWDWHLLPGLLKKQYYDYARANASIGINGTVLTNVNANALVLTKPYIEKIKALANVFRPYGIKVYVTARFSAPIESGDLTSADPLLPEVQQWWNAKAKEIYTEIPDFGGFLVKANSEGQPGPNNYGRSHVDGANMLATALEPYGGIVMWRAFVYSENNNEDRAKQAYSEFKPFDGKFKSNVMLQVKNGAIDFQPREPFHPLFGAMPKTPLMMEFQITQEYLGFSSHLVFLPKLYEETLQEDTYALGKGSTVAKVIDGSLHNYNVTGMAGVSNIGSAHNWTGHPFGQANWYGFGRLAWNPELSAETIAKEWITMTFGNNEEIIKKLTPMLLISREAVVNYMTPIGLHHIMGAGHHYGPGPWVDYLPRPDWNSIYYHKADSEGIGFNRTSSGSDALSQYNTTIQKKYNNPKTIPEKYLLWFHHLPWNYTLTNGKTLWEHMTLKYEEGVQQVSQMQKTWSTLEPYINSDVYKEVTMLLTIQYNEAVWWRDACILYFQQFSEMQIPSSIPAPKHNLEYYKSLQFPYAPGN